MENKEWFLYVVDHHEGPFSATEIKKLVKKGDAKTTSYVWKDGLEDWMLMADVTEFGQGSSKSDGHGPFSFVTNLLKRKPKAEAAAAADTAAGAEAPGEPMASVTPDASGAFDASALAAGDGDAVPSGPDVSDVSPSDSVWCLNSNKEFSGPFSLKNIVRKINEGEVSVEDGVWKEGWKSFTRISNIAGFMEGVKPDVLSGKTDKKKKKKKKISAEAKGAAAAMGMGGKSSVRVHKWYRARNVTFVLVVGGLATLYQAVAMGYLDGALDKVPELKAKVKAAELKPIPYERLTDYVSSALSPVMPALYRAVDALPEPLQVYFTSVQVPENVLPADAETMREVAGADLKSGVKVAAAMPNDDTLNPSFYIASNAPNGTSFTVVLRGKDGTLLNTMSYEKSVNVEVVKHIANVPRFTYDGTKPLPRGEYALIVFEADKQASAEATAALATSPKKNPPSIIPPGKVAFVVDSFFLGGKKDATYDSRLKEYRDRVASKLGGEAAELKQLALLVEQMANESATKFQTLIVAPPTPQRKNLWAQYHANYAKLSGQVKTSVTAKSTPAMKAELVLPQIWERLEKTYQLTEQLHQSETDAIEKALKADAVNAAPAAAAINELKTAIFKVIK